VPDPDLIAYLDGEADPAIARLLDVRLGTEPELRERMLVLMRQRVALTRVLLRFAPVALPARRHQPHRWWLIAAAGLAAASVAVAIVITRPSTRTPPLPPMTHQEPATKPGTIPDGTVAKPSKPIPAPPTPPTPQRDTPPKPGVPEPPRLADGTVLVSGVVIEAGDQLLERRLADGTVFALAMGAALEVPAAGAPWRLRRGAMTCDLPPGVRSARDGIASDEALVTAVGQIHMSMSTDGTRLRLLAGQASARDMLTAVTTALRVGEEWWIPSDRDAPRDDADGFAGITRGTVIEVRAKGHGLALRTRFGTFIFVPEWLAQPSGFDPAMSARLATLRRGDQVELTWRREEHLRVQAVRLIAPAPEVRKDVPPSSANDF